MHRRTEYLQTKNEQDENTHILVISRCISLYLVVSGCISLHLPTVTIVTICDYHHLHMSHMQHNATQRWLTISETASNRVLATLEYDPLVIA